MFGKLFGFLDEGKDIYGWVEWNEGFFFIVLICVIFFFFVFMV